MKRSVQTVAVAAVALVALAVPGLFPRSQAQAMPAAGLHHDLATGTSQGAEPIRYWRGGRWYYGPRAYYRPYPYYGYPYAYGYPYGPYYRPFGFYGRRRW